MKKYAAVFVVVMLLVAGTACNKINIPGNIAGQILDENGAPRGMVTVQLVDVNNNNEVLDQQTADDLGNYFFSKVPPGTYKIVTMWGGNTEMPNDADLVKLAPGKTKNINVTISKED